MPAQSADSLGRLGEKLAARYLSERGYRILEERYTNTRGYRLGEVDIIAEYQGYLRFIEVKTSLLRKEDLFSPEERLSPRKLHLLEGMAERYIREKRFFEYEYGFDAVLVLYDPEQKSAKIRLLEDIFL